MRITMWMASAVLAASLTACVTPNEVAMEVGAAPGTVEGTTTVDLRVLQTRRFETPDEVSLLLAATDTLQDLGFTITASSADVGVLVASKERNAEESGQVAGQIALTVFAALLGVYHNPTWDTEQSIFVTLIATPIEGAEAMEIRVSFDRRMTNNHGRQWRTELIMEQEVYREFFDKLAAAVFLEAHRI